MNMAFRHETFRGDYTFRNSPASIRRFPFPFHEDSYMYSVNMEPHVPAGPPGHSYNNLIDVDEHYLAELEDRAIVLKEDPLRCQVLPHMMQAQWDTLELLMEHQSREFPEHFSLSRDGDRWHWINRPMGIDVKFVFGDAASLPLEPFEFITRQAQGDFCVVDQRDGQLWMDAGMVTTQADWSLDFDIGMNFMEWHGPVPLAHQIGVFDRALKFLLNLQQGQPRELSPVGQGPRLRDRRQRRKQGASALRVAEPVAAAPLERHPVRHPVLSAQDGGAGAGPQVGTPVSPRVARPASRAGRLQGADAIPGRDGGVAVEV
jgi:Protein of unknown function (DUF3445)